MTFRACSSPAPTRVKPQPAPAILSQESVHTPLSITHHTKKRPSTGPRTTHGPQDGASEFFLSTHHPTHHYAPRGPTSRAPECRAQLVLLDVMFMVINPNKSTPGQHESKADSVSVMSGQQGYKGIFPILFFSFFFPLLASGLLILVNNDFF
jgi:hypothetical protein